MSRYLLRATLSALTGSRADAYCESDLYRLINQAVQAKLQTEGRKGVPSTATRVETLIKIGRVAPEDATIVQALAAFLRAAIDASAGDTRAERRATAAVEWLSGELIETEAAELIGLPAADQDGASLADDTGVEGVFRVLARLAAAAGQVFILCVDQVDNLDDDQVKALSAFLHVLVDHTRNLLIVTSGVKQSMTSFRERHVIAEAAWDRLSQHIVELNRVDGASARQLIEARVTRFLQPFRDLASVVALCKRDQLFPLDDSWLTSRLGDLFEFRPRDIISWAHARWEEQQEILDTRGGAHWLKAWPGNGTAQPAPSHSREQAIDALSDLKIEEILQQRKLQPEGLPSDADNLATLVFTLLGHCRGDARYSLVELQRLGGKGRTPIYDLVARERNAAGKMVSSGVLFVTSNNKIKVTNALKHMLEDPKPPDHRILVTDEERRPLALGPRGVEYYDKLRKLGQDPFSHVKLSFEEYAGLDAFAGLLGSARVGDLEVEHPPGQFGPVSEAEAVESLHRHKKLLDHRLLHHLLTEEGPIPAPVKTRELLDLMRVRHTIQDHLSWRLGLTTKELTNVLIETEKLNASRFDGVHAFVRDVAVAMHNERVIHATSQGDSMFLQLLAGH